MTGGRHFSVQSPQNPVCALRISLWTLRNSLWTLRNSLWTLRNSAWPLQNSVWALQIPLFLRAKPSPGEHPKNDIWNISDFHAICRAPLFGEQSYRFLPGKLSFAPRKAVLCQERITRPLFNCRLPY